MRTHAKLGLFFLAGLALSSLLLPVEGVAQKKKGGGVIRLEEMIIEGRVQKPNAFFISSRQPLVYEVMEVKESFVPDIIKAVEDGPF
ncbi:MAG: hypothetical protein MUC50_14120 [Myxococcota bacterium]|jgi:hypothetical protein|nr:hypothetical protein [Myxococcota bacterium]